MKMKLGRHQWCVVIKLGIEKNAKVIICVELNPRAFNLLLGGNVYMDPAIGINILIGMELDNVLKIDSQCHWE